MKTVFVPILTFLMSAQAFAQDTIRVYFDSSWKATTANNAVYIRKKFKTGNMWSEWDYYASGKIKAKGTYLDSACKTEQGEIIRYYDNGTTSTFIQYEQGKRNGHYINNYENGNKKMEGYYKQDKTDGDWVSYYESGKLAGKAHFDEGRQTMAEFYNADGSRNNTIDSFFLRAEFPGGTEAMNRFLYLRLKYPREAIDNEIQGTVIVQFVVEKDGTVRDIAIARSVFQPIDQEALRVIRAMPPWKPALWGGMVATSWLKLPILFRLEHDNDSKKKKRGRNK